MSKTYFFKFSVTFLFLFVFLGTGLLFFISSQYGDMLRNFIRPFFVHELLENKNTIFPKTCDVLYVLGGSGRAQRYKFDEVANLYRQGACSNILLMSVDQLTPYDVELKKNLSFDEWSVRQLGKLGVPSKNIEVVRLKEGFFGTLSEAKGLAELARKRDYRTVLLVASEYHAKRVRKSFTYFMQDLDVQICIATADEPAYLRGFVREWLKLKVYEILIFMDGKMKIPILLLF